MAFDPILEPVLERNAQWAEDVEKAVPGFFTESAKGQHPKVLWIGCADSRVPESVLTASKPGEIFVHRNVANQFHPEDDNAQAVLAYAVNDVGVTHIVLTGHTNCGGAAACHAAANGPTPPGPPKTPLDRWLAPMIALAKGLTAAELVVENVRVQVQNLAKSETITAAWASGKDVQVHGWIYELESGRLRDLGITRTKNHH